MTRGPVHDADIEDAVIGGLLVGGSWLDEVLATGLVAEDFYVPSHNYAYAAICSLASRGQPVDNLTVAAELRALGPAGPTGADLVASMVNAPVASHLPAYAQRIRALARLRALVAAGRELVELGTTPTSDVEAALGHAEQLVLAATSTGREDAGSSLAVEMVDELLDQLRARQEGTAPLPMSTGSVDLDRQLHGGFRAGQLVVLGARPSMGKTALVLGMAVAAAQRDVPTLYCSLEMSRAEVAERFLAMEGVSTDVQAAGLSERDWARAAQAREKLRTWPLRVDDDAAATVLTVRSRARRMASRQGLGLVVVDYLQLMSHRETENRQTQVAEISRELKRLARELSVPVIAVSQLSRNLEAREDKVPRLADLRESGQLEQDADAVLFLHRPGVYDKKADPGEAHVIVAKHRNGPTGLVRLVWLPKRMRFADPSHRETDH
jgi:replicative DNA helicase